MAKNWIQKAVKKPGALRKSLGIKKGKKIPAAKLNAAAKKGGKLGQRARLAQTFKKISEADAILKIYLEKPVGIGEHPQHIDEADKLIQKIATAEENLKVLEEFGDAV